MGTIPANERMLGQLLDGLDSTVAALPVSDVVLDSRLVAPGDLFLACIGEQFDGRDFIDAAIAAGAVAVFAEAPCDSSRWSQPVIEVPDLSAKISAIAGRFCGEPSAAMSLVGVTGTNGKSSVVLVLAQVLELLQQPCGVIGTLGCGRVGQLQASINTTPDAVSLQKLLAEWRSAGASWAAMEVSSHGLVQERVAALQFKAAVFTNLTTDHLDYHGTLDNYRDAKARLFAHPELELAVLNRDDPASATMRAALAPAVRVVEFSLAESDADIHVLSANYAGDGTCARLATPWGEFDVQTPLLGDFNLSNTMAVIGVLGGLACDVAAVCSALRSVQPLAGRMQRFGHADGLSVVVDYAHTPDALEQALVNVRRHCAGRLWCVFGCGGNRDSGKRPQMGAIAARLADYVLITNDNPRREAPQSIADAIVSGMDPQAAANVVVELDRATAINRAISSAASGDLVLVAGKGHEDYQLIGDARLSFSDCDAVREALSRRVAA